MRRKERLWNLCVLQKERLSNLSCFIIFALPFVPRLT